MAEGSRYQNKEEKHGRWRPRLKYAAGIAALVFTVLLALFLPGWYSGWSEGEVMEQVVLEKRDEIRFFDMEALDISTKLAMLGDSEEFNYSVMYDMMDSGERRQQDQEILDEKISEWYACHLLPEQPFYPGEEDGLSVSLDSYVRIDAGIIPVRVLLRARYLENYLITGDAIEIAILDQSNDFLYYLGIASDAMSSYMLHNLGVETDEELDQRLSDGTYSKDMIRDPSWYDYASVCSADSQKMEMTDFTGFFQQVTLQYEEFDVSAFRSIFEYSMAIGVQTMFGTDRWEELAYAVVGMYLGEEIISEDYSEWADTWNETVVSYGRDDLILVPDAGAEEADDSVFWEKEFVVGGSAPQEEAALDAEYSKEEVRDRELREKYGINPYSLSEEKREMLWEDVQDQELQEKYGIDLSSLSEEEKEKVYDKMYGIEPAQEEMAASAEAYEGE